MNIATFALGRSTTGAVGVVNVEDTKDNGGLRDNVVEEIQKIPAVLSARLVRI